MLYEKHLRRKLMAKYNVAKLFDFTALMEIHKKNIEALSEANKLAFEGFQAVAQRQAELFSQTVAESSSLIKEIMAEGTTEEKAARQADLVKKAYEKSVSDWHLLTSMIGGAGEEASSIISNRVVSSLTEFKSALNKNEKGNVHKKVA
jgi:phasin family protein